MGKLSVTTFLTLDGVMQAPGGPQEDTSGNFAYGGWVVPFFDDDMGAFVTSIIKRADAFLLGRKTYDIFAGHWPQATDPADEIAVALNGCPKYVASKTLKAASWKGTTILGGDAVADIKRLKERHKDLQVHGSGHLAQTLMAHGLVDEFNLLFYPLILGGTHKRLFASGAVPEALSLVNSKTSSTGVLLCTYKHVGKPETGAFGLDT